MYRKLWNCVEKWWVSLKDLVLLRWSLKNPKLEQNPRSSITGYELPDYQSSVWLFQAVFAIFASRTISEQTVGGLSESQIRSMIVWGVWDVVPETTKDDPGTCPIANHVNPWMAYCMCVVVCVNEWKFWRRQDKYYNSLLLKTLALPRLSPIHQWMTHSLVTFILTHTLILVWLTV